MDNPSNSVIKRRRTGRTEIVGIVDKKVNHPYSVEYIFGLFFVLLVGFFGSQKLIHTVLSPNSSINIYMLNGSICENGFRLPFFNCDKQEVVQNLEPIVEVAQVTFPQKIEQSDSLIVGMNKGPNALSLSKQFAYLESSFG